MSTPVSRARAADSVVFAILGTVFATWAVRIPAVRTGIGLAPGAIGVALLGLAVGSIVGLVTGGGLVSRYGGREVIRAGLGVYCLALPVIGVVDGLAGLVGTLVIFGFGKGLADVAANAQGVRIERRYPGQIMGSLHGLFSAGGLLGAGVGAVATSLGLSVRTHFAVVGVAALVVGLSGGRWLLETDAEASAGPGFALPSKELAGFCFVGFCALFIEGVGNDWSAVFLKTTAGTTATVAALGFGVFSFAMMAGRFLADRVVAHTGIRRFVQLTALVAALGLGLALVAESMVSLVGFGLLGLGLAGLMPVAMSAAGNHDPDAPSEPAIAAVSTAGYGGFAIGPVGIGGLAQATTLRVALVPAVVLAVCVVVLAGMLPFTRRIDHGDTVGQN